MNINHNRCISCKYYDGLLCTKDLNNMDYDLSDESMYKAPFDTCEDFEEDLEYEEEEDE